MKRVDLNCDLGESFGNYRIGMDEAVIPHISSANIACGWHGGDPMVLRHTMELAKQAGIGVGAHPGFPDLLGFGRRTIQIIPEEAYSYTLYQLGALYGFARAAGLSVQHLKPHGALYNMAAKDLALSTAICQAIRDFDPHIILLALSGSKMLQAAQEVGILSACEVFADRAYNEDGSLVSRSLPGAVIHDTQECVRRVSQMVREGTVTAITGKTVPIRCDSICVHGDNESAVAFVKAIRERLNADGVEIVPLRRVVEG